jgi:hypothetical protein
VRRPTRRAVPTTPTGPYTGTAGTITGATGTTTVFVDPVVCVVSLVVVVVLPSDVVVVVVVVVLEVCASPSPEVAANANEAHTIKNDFIPPLLFSQLFVFRLHCKPDKIG